jgi:hypothetical protein
MKKSATLDPKAVQIFPSGHLAQEWQTRVAGVAYPDLFVTSTWSEVEKRMRTRKGKCPVANDLLRVIAADGSYDVTTTIVRVSDGYTLEFRHGRTPAALSQVLNDLDALQAGDASEMKDRAKDLPRRWKAMGATREDLNAARRRAAKSGHPDVNPVDGKHLAAVNALLDTALASLPEGA